MVVQGLSAEQIEEASKPAVLHSPLALSGSFKDFLCLIYSPRAAIASSNATHHASQRPDVKVTVEKLYP
jgi:hypothetical protein